MQQQQQQQPQDVSFLVYRMTNLEQHVQDLQEQLKLYVPARENDLQIRAIHDTVQRIEKDVQDAKKQLSDMNIQLVQRDAAVQQGQDRVQIKTLVYIVTTIVTIAMLVFVGYVTHLFH